MQLLVSMLSSLPMAKLDYIYLNAVDPEAGPHDFTPMCLAVFCIAAALQAFRKQLRSSSSAVTFLISYVAASPQWQELQAIWETQLSLKDLKVTVELLALLADILSLQQPPQGDTAAAPAAGHAAAGDAEAAAGTSSGSWQQLSLSVDDLATSIINRRLKALYFNLSSGRRLRTTT